MESELTCPACLDMFKTELPESMRKGELWGIECPCCCEKFEYECEEDYGEAS